MKKMFLPVSRPTCLGGEEKGMVVVVVCGQGFVFVSEEEAAFVNQYKEEDGKSFAVSPHWAMDATDSQLLMKVFLWLTCVITFWVNSSSSM